MKLKFIKASPCSNTTILILSSHSSKQYSEIAMKVMDYDHLAAEQLGFIVKPNNSMASLRLEMAGNEFCGNALISAAALARRNNLANNDTFFLESSGTDELLSCEVKLMGGENYLVKVQMPSQYDIKNFEITTNNYNRYTGSLISLPGINHFVFEGILNETEYESIMTEFVKSVASSAYGIIPFKDCNNGIYEIRPYVYVPSAKSKIYEKSCGSGSFSLGLMLNAGINKTIQVLQPGGKITVTTGGKNYLEENMFFSCEGNVFI